MIKDFAAPTFHCWYHAFCPYLKNRARNYKILLSAIINLICGRPALDMMKYNDRPFHLCVPFFFRIDDTLRHNFED